jgi:hypothetical protein
VQAFYALSLKWSLLVNRRWWQQTAQSCQARREPVPTSGPWRMDGKWSGNSFLLGSSSLANHGA